MINSTICLHKMHTFSELPVPHIYLQGWLDDVNAINGYEATGASQSMFANQLSYFFDFHGKLTKLLNFL